MKKHIITLSIGLLGWMGIAFGQNEALLQLARPGSTAEWLKVRPELSLPAADFLQALRPALQLPVADELRISSVKTDELGMTHYRLQQFAHGFPVRGLEYQLHEKDGRVQLANGKLVAGIPAPPPGWMNESKAVVKALDAVPSTSYLWLDEKATAQLRQRTENPDTSFYPKGKMVWECADLRKGYSPDNMQLCWAFDIFTDDGRSATVLLNAYTGELIRKIPLDIHCDPGTGNTTWNGNVTVNSDQSGSSFILLDDCQSPNIHVFNGNDSASTAFATEYVDGDNVWTNTSAVQTYFGLRQSWQYYLTQHGRDSYDDSAANINGYNEAGFISSSGNTYWSNASWSPGSQVLRFGDNATATATDDWNSVDIVGHEFTHAVTQFSAGLQYLGESGALNESFSDIFGEMVELFTEGTMDWLVGGDRGAIRDLSAPGNFGDPDTYLGTNWFPTTADSIDNGGVHTNSGVQNYWFYLLSQGGSGFNDNGDYFEVQGIGPVNAARIAYRNLTTYLGPTSDYAAAKDGAIQAAEDLFGSCSNEVFQTARAWAAVGLYTSDALGYDIAIDCPSLNAIHGLLLPYSAVALNDIYSDCNIAANGTLVSFQAGHHVVLRPGFRSGDDFHAFIAPCGASSAGLGSRSAVLTLPGTHPKPTASVAASLQCTAYPNPFSGSFRLQYDLPQTTEVSLLLYDQTGRLQRRLADRELQDSGFHSREFETGNLDDGVYYLELITPSEKRTLKLVKLRN
ncbi:MAG: hypothetical protein CMN32_11850 [Saprospirales bacterium]|nr:hypothetical protein [Saprospirales bacterium]